MKRRDLFKFGIFSVLAATAGTGFFKIYKHHTGVKEIFGFPAPILRKVSSPVDSIGDKISRPNFIKVKYKDLDDRENELTATNGYAALLTHEIDHLNGILFIDYEHAGLDT